ncbi:MAG TPA: signal recognition particle receptor subunit alpha, partial [Atribacterota bacterium]|nr:signal recognition particle receptor subunit alpha [Atribacterota bacterium]
MLDKLAERLQYIFNKIREKGKISEYDIKQSLREIKLALLEADVNYQVVKEFINRLEQQASGEVLSKTLTPGQQIIKITHGILAEILGEKQNKIKFNDKGQTIILL